MKKTQQPATVHPLPRPTTVEDMSEAQIHEVMDMETQLTAFQVTFMMKMAASQASRIPLWGHPKKDDWAKSQTLPLYYAPGLLTEAELREFLQLKELERMKLVNLIQEHENMFWRLTARGRLVAIWHLSIAADYQAQTTASA